MNLPDAEESAAAPPAGASDATGQRDASMYNRLLASARRVFDRLGWNRATVQDIVEDAGVSRGSFYVYFDNKRAVFDTLVTSMMDDLYARAEARRPGDTIFARLEAGNRAFLEVWARDPDLMKNMSQLSWMDQEAEELLTSMRSRFIARTQAAIERHRDSGITHELDPQLAAAALAGMVESFAMRHFVHGEPRGADYDLETMSYELTALWYRAVYNDNAPLLPPRGEYLSQRAG